jgi:thiol-disulfide isomerase/thioredoxin
MVAGAFALGLGSATAKAVVVGDALTGVALKPVQGAGELKADQEGKILLVNFWATWCAACKVELLEMEEKLAARLGDKDFEVAFVSLDKEPEKASEWFKSHLKAPEKMLPHLYSDAAFELADKLGVDSFPMTIIIGKDGKVAHVQKGFTEGQGSTEKLVKVSEDLLKAAH